MVSTTHLGVTQAECMHLCARNATLPTGSRPTGECGPCIMDYYVRLLEADGWTDGPLWRKVEESPLGSGQKRY